MLCWILPFTIIIVVPEEHDGDARIFSDYSYKDSEDWPSKQSTTANCQLPSRRKAKARCIICMFLAVWSFSTSAKLSCVLSVCFWLCEDSFRFKFIFSVTLVIACKFDSGIAGRYVLPQRRYRSLRLISVLRIYFVTEAYRSFTHHPYYIDINDDTIQPRLAPLTTPACSDEPGLK